MDRTFVENAIVTWAVPVVENAIVTWTVPVVENAIVTWAVLIVELLYSESNPKGAVFSQNLFVLSMLWCVNACASVHKLGCVEV